MQSYRKELTHFVVVFAPPLFGGRGIMTRGVKFSLQHSAKIFKQNLADGIVVVGAYADAKKEFVTNKMAAFLQNQGVPAEAIVHVPYPFKTDPLNSLEQKFSIENEHEEALRSKEVELRMVVTSNISEYYCIKTLEFKGLRILGSPEEVEVPFSLQGFLETCYYSMRDCLQGFARLIAE